MLTRDNVDWGHFQPKILSTGNAVNHRNIDCLAKIWDSFGFGEALVLKNLKLQESFGRAFGELWAKLRALGELWESWDSFESFGKASGKLRESLGKAGKASGKSWESFGKASGKLGQATGKLFGKASGVKPWAKILVAGHHKRHCKIFVI